MLPPSTAYCVTKISVEDMLNTKDLVALTEHQQVG